MNTNQITTQTKTINLENIIDNSKLFGEIKEHPELMKTKEEFIKDQTEYVNVRNRLASVLGVKPLNVVIRFINKMRTEPNYDPILALSVLTPYLEQDTELLQKVERLIYQGIPEDQGTIQVTCVKEIVDDNNVVEGSPTFRRNRNV